MQRGVLAATVVAAVCLVVGATSAPADGGEEGRVALGAQATAPVRDHFRGLTAGVHTLAGVRFQVGESRCRVGPGETREITLPRSRPAAVHFLHYLEFSGATVGAYRLRYADGREVAIPLAGGVNVQDWWRPAPLDFAELAYEDVYEHQGPQPVGLWAFSIRNPRNDADLASLVVANSHEQAAINLVAVTLAQELPAADAQLVYDLTPNWEAEESPWAEGIPVKRARAAGPRVFGDVSFQIADRRLRVEAGTSAEVEVGVGKAASLHFLHYTEGSAARVGSYVVTYADGQEQRVELRDARNIGDWWYPRDLPGARLVHRDVFEHEGPREVGFWLCSVRCQPRGGTVVSVRARNESTSATLNVLGLSVTTAEGECHPVDLGPEAIASLHSAFAGVGAGLLRQRVELPEGVGAWSVRVSGPLSQLWADGKPVDLAHQGEPGGGSAAGVELTLPGPDGAGSLALSARAAAPPEVIARLEALPRETQRPASRFVPLSVADDRLGALGRYALPQSGSRRTLVVRGVPFRSVPDVLAQVEGSAAGADEGGRAVMPCGLQAEALFFLGCVGSPDLGSGSWYSRPEVEYASQYFVGDTIGHIEVRYEDGARDLIPLTFGFTVWYDTPWWRTGQEPFAGSERARGALRDSLFLHTAYPRATSGEGTTPWRYVLAVQPRAKRIRELRIADNPGKVGHPVITGVTAIAREGHEAAGFEVLPGPALDLAAFRPVTPELLAQRGYEARLEALKRQLYVCEEMLPERPALDRPAGFECPRIEFQGGRLARMLTNEYYHCLWATKLFVCDDGTHTVLSSGFPWYGDYRNAMGCWSRGTGQFASHYETGGHMWARDVGRAVSELAELGFETATRAAVDFFDRTLDLCSPPHWTRNWGQETVSRRHQTYEGLEYVGQAQNNGHALVMIARYHVWLHTGKSQEWLRAHWKATVKATEWICWQVDHRKSADQPDGLVHEEGEEGFGWEASYANFACYTALRMSVAMAEALGATEQAARWAFYRDRMENAIREHLWEQGAHGPSWRYHRRTDWNDYNQSLAPIMLICDFESFDPQDTDRRFLEISLNTYLDRLGEPPDYEDCRAFGYGQGFITQAALLLDRMGDATRFVENTAKYIYDPREYPWVAAEGTVVDESGHYWYRMGMFANQIQIASIVKVLRLLVGIDDLDSRELKVLPRLPGSPEGQASEWEGITVSDYPVLCDDGDQPVVRKLGYRLARKGRRLELELTAEHSLPDVSVRLGPLPADSEEVRVTVNGRQVEALPVASGDSRWVWVRHLASVRRTRIGVDY